MANGFIGQVNIGNDQHLIGSTLFATSSTLGDNGAKVAELQSSAVYTTTTGITIHVKFDHGNTITSGSSLTLKVGNDSAHPIVNPNGALTWNDNSIISFTYDGTNWVINSSGIDASSTSLTLGNISSSGTLTNTAATIATGDYLVITDTSDNSGRIAKANLSFDTTKTNYFLSQAGSWTQIDKTSLEINNVTNHAQVTSLQWDSTNKKITYKVSEGSAQNVVEFEQGSNITLTAAANKLTIAGTNDAVTQTNTTGDATYNLLFSYSTSTTDTKTEGVRKHSTLTYNPSTGILSATKFSGDGSGLTNVTASSIDWNDVSNTPTTLSRYGITDALSSSATITIAGNSVSLNGGSLAADTLRTSLGLSKALRFVGKATTTISESTTTAPTISGITNYTPVVGDVVLDKDNEYEYVCIATNGTTYTWEQLGSSSSYALSDEVIHNSLITTAGDIIVGTTSGSSVIPSRLGAGTAGQVLTIVSGVPAWADNQATDNKVAQALDTSSNKYALLFSDNQTSTTTATITTGAKRNNSIYVTPSAGSITATKFIGALEGTLRASDVKSALGTGTESGLVFLHKSGDWKTLQITNTTTTIASVSNGILTLTASVKENATLGIAT